MTTLSNVLKKFVNCLAIKPHPSKICRHAAWSGDPGSKSRLVGSPWLRRAVGCGRLGACAKSPEIEFHWFMRHLSKNLDWSESERENERERERVRERRSSPSTTQWNREWERERQKGKTYLLSFLHTHVEKNLTHTNNRKKMHYFARSGNGGEVINFFKPFP